MTATIIDGKAEAARIRERLREKARAFRDQAGRPPGLHVVLVGEDPASEVYVRNKARAAEAAGFASWVERLPAETAEADLLERIAALNLDPRVDGILVQLPLPDHIAEERIIEAIDPAKDVDGFHPMNAGRLLTGGRGLVPCTPLGCLHLIRMVRPDLSGARALVIGRSNIVGKPVALLLLAAHATVTVAHSRTRDLPALAREADVLVAAVGRAEMVRGGWIKPGAIVIDVGINRLPPAAGEGKGRLVGDVAFAEAAAVAGAITPVPGGVGPMTIAMLLSNTLTAAIRRAGLATEPASFVG